ncbi:MAG: hypothetical protein M3Z26_14670 [Bacteroidota bacterium]|nr:hypothetical protein [Bacteroidota bacterium]
MIPKKFKHIEDVLDDYISLLDEEKELPILIQKVHDKLKQHLSDDSTIPYKPKETEDMFRIFIQIKKYEERKTELGDEKIEVENILKEFISLLNGSKISYEKKDDNDKSKSTFLFWLQDGNITSNR